jgi:hypothetical protein
MRSMKDPMMLAVARNVLGMSEEDIQKVTPEQEREYKTSIENMGKYRLVAEVVKSRYCAAGLKVGQKIVINGAAIDKEATDCPLCVGRCAAQQVTRSTWTVRAGATRRLLGGVACIDPASRPAGSGVLFDVRVDPSLKARMLGHRRTRAGPSRPCRRRGLRAGLTPIRVAAPRLESSRVCQEVGSVFKDGDHTAGSAGQARKLQRAGERCVFLSCSRSACCSSR